MDDILTHKMKKLNKTINDMCVSTKQGAEAFADAIYSISYRVKEHDSQVKSNQRNIGKLNNN
jgi:hypothetical protein